MRQNKLLTFFLTFFFPLLLGAQDYYDSENVKLLSRLPAGPTRAVAIGYNELYFGKGALLEVLTKTDTAFNVIGEFTAHGTINDISMVGNYVFLASGTFGLEIVNVTDTHHPSLEGYVRMDDEAVAVFATDVYTTSPVVFVLTDHSGVFVYDASTPSNPQLLSTFETSGTGKDLYGDKDNLKLYVAEYNKGFEILSISDPKQLTRLGSYNTTGLSYGITVSDNVAYVADYQKGLVLFNVANPAAITKIVGFQTRGAAYDVVYVPDTKFAYVALGAEGIVGIDVTEASYPAYYSFSHAGNALNLAVCDTLLFVANGTGGLEIVKATKTEMDSCYNVPAEGNAIGLYLEGDKLHVAKGFGGYEAVDVSDYTAPVPLGFYNIEKPEYSKNVAVLDTIAFVANGTGGVLELSIAQPELPKLINKIELSSGTAFGVFIENNKLYVAAGNGGVKIYSLENLNHPTEVASFGTAYSATNIFVRDTIAYISDYLDGLALYNVAEGSIGVKLSQTDVPVNGLDIYVQGDTAYVAGSVSGARIIDVSDPHAARQVAYIRPEEFSVTRGIFVDDSLMYLADAETGLHVIKLAEVPSIVGHFQTGGSARDVIVRDGIIYLADDNDGIYLLKYEKTTAVEKESVGKELNFVLKQNYPNPFNPTTQIEFSLSKTSNVFLDVFDVTGKKVKELLNKRLSSGNYKVQFNAEGLSSGVYFYRLRTGGVSSIKKMLLMK